MKGKLFGSSKNRAQQHPEISQPFPINSLPPPGADPRNNPPLQYQRIDPSQQPPPPPPSQQQLQQQSQQRIPPSQESLGRSPSQRRVSSLPSSDPHNNPHAGYISQHQQLADEAQQQRPPEYRQSAYFAGGPAGPGASSQHWPEEKERRGLRDRLGLKHSKDLRHEQGGPIPSRKLSVRGKHSPNPERLPESDGRASAWGRQSNSSQLLLSPTEEDDESQHNRFVNPQAQFNRPQVHGKDFNDEDDFRQAQQRHPDRQQDYYPPPESQPNPLLKQYRAQGSSEQVYLPPEQQGRPPQQQGQYRQYPEQQFQAPNQQYQHYPPPPAHASQEISQNHPDGPPPGYLVTSGDQQGQQVQLQHSPEDPPQQYPPALRNQAVEDDADQDLELHQPQASRLPPGQSEGNYLQAPPALKTHAPPSPVQGQPADQQSITAPQQTPSPNSTQPDSAQMPNPSRSGAGGIRNVDGIQVQGYRGQGPPPQDGRTTPGASEKIPVDMTPEDIEHYHQLMRDHKELKDKYQKVKKYYFEKESQVHELQNTLANQRLSASRTSLDDSEYTARFNRLDGLISQLAFSIRKSWINIPEWLHRAVNKDAIPTGKQEMTAVGRAFISWWLYSEIFERIFHPDLEINLSIQLKNILNNIRRFSPPITSDAEDQSLSSKLVSWRMTTVEGIQDQLRSPQAQQHRASLLEHLNAQLIGDVSIYLTDPAPPDLAGGVFMIVELAANIISHLPLESREVVIDYYPPSCRIQPEVMKLEQGIPALTNPILGNGVDDNDDDSAKDAFGGASEASREDEQAPPPPPHKDDVVPKGKRGMLANLMGAASGKPPSGPQQSAGPQNPGAAGKVGAPGNGPPQGSGKSNGRDTPGQPGGKDEIVRMSVGLGVGIRGRSVLVRAPVYTTFV